MALISLWRGIVMCVSTRPGNGGCQPTRQLPRFAAFLLFTLQILLLPAAAPVTQFRAQSELLAWAAANPATSVQVIVQKALADQTVEQWVTAADGLITQELPIINAFAAEVPASQVRSLAALSGVRWLSLDAPVIESACSACIDTTKLQNLYNRTVRADQVWNLAPNLQGQGIGIAVVDSGIKVNHPDLANRVIVNIDKAGLALSANDGYGHGTLVAGVMAGNGSAGNGAYIGIAPKANLINVKVTTNLGASTESDVVRGLQWIYDNREKYNIRVVNLSLNSSMQQSYHTSPMSAAVEVLWFNGIVVVAAAGNNGSADLFPPANDPFIITVGATDEVATATLTDDVVASFSAYGTTEDGYAKPDLVAPGRHLVSTLSSRLAQMAVLHPANVVNSSYIRLSGTSLAAPIVSGAVALLLQDEPHLTPDQVKYRLMATANKNWPGYTPALAGAGYLDIYAAVHGVTTESANVGLPVSKLLTTEPSSLLTISINGSSVNWSSVNWSSVNWSSVNWSSDYWEPLGGLVNRQSALEPTDSAEGSEEFTAEVEEQNQRIFLPLVTR
jgi:serine protease AprX